MKAFIFRLFGGVKSILFIVVIGTGLFLHLYTQHIINQLRDEARTLVVFYSRMYAAAAETEASDLSFIFNEIILKTTIPIIQTDTEKKPVAWKGISIDPNDKSEEAVKKVQKMVDRLEGEIEAIPIHYQDMVLGYLYYSDSRLIQQLQWLPYVEVGIVGLLILAGFIGYANIKRSEQRHIWVGMAKETAHQLGTPISSLLGWLEIMRSKKRFKREEIYGEMEKDLSRLEQVTRRFSQIGSKPVLKPAPPAEVLGNVCEYIRKRVPHVGRQVEVIENYEPVPDIEMNADLFQWAVENIVKNSLDAMDKKEGTIEVRMRKTGPDGVAIEIEDNGRGMDPSIKKKIFKPGFSTKKRGWGLGLTLSKRIIEEYHGGHLCIKDTRPSCGTTMRIEL